MGKLLSCLVTTYFVLAFVVPFKISAQDNKKPTLPTDTLPQKLSAKPPDHFLITPLVPKDNPVTVAKISLGRKLFFDPILSKNNTVSCASCHQPQHGFASPDALAIGIGGTKGKRNAPSLLNRSFGKSFFWDGRTKTLELQSLEPIKNKAEFDSSVTDVIARLKSKPEYVKQFQTAFSTKKSTTGQPQNLVTSQNLAQALATFQRTLYSGETPVDQFQSGQYNALTQLERQGLWIFESRGNCWKCHSGDNFSDEQFHNTGIGYGTENRDLGRFQFTQKKQDKGKFKTPTLREVEHTAPYMHDGSLKTLREVVEFYNAGGNSNDPNLDRNMKPLGLTEKEIDSVVAFLKALSARKKVAKKQSRPKKR